MPAMLWTTGASLQFILITSFFILMGTNYCLNRFSVWKITLHMIRTGLKSTEFKGFLEKSLKIKYAMKSTGKSLKGLEKSFNFYLFSLGLNIVDRDLNPILYLFLVLISPLTQSSISKSRILTHKSAHKHLVLENCRKILRSL